ncbi:MAG: ABC transporter substrate-binding protein [Christensenellaceae bacterium]|jgi:peptide/nickel transport system substrate-binding protein|nr:ABC transporter substrate-binding protein [Christensenellaceae bacterium]
MKTSTNKLMALIAATTVLAMVLTACGGAPAAASPSGSKNLNISCTTTPETMDPHRGSGENDLMIFVNVYETLVRPNDTDSGAEAFLAKDWTVSDDGLSWQFNLRDDVTFSDGTPLTAKDVKYSMDRLIGLGEGYAFIFTDLVKETSVVDDYTVAFELSKPFGPFLNALTTVCIVNSTLLEANTVDGNYGENGDYGTGFLLTNTAGSGPYVISEFLVHDSINLAKSAGYWGTVPEAAPDAVRVIELQDAATTKMMLTSGELDMVHGHQERTTLESLIANEGIETGDLPELGLNYFMINTKKAPTDDVHIRRAISYATNYEEMSKIYGDMPEAIGPVPTTLWGHAAGLNRYTYDIDKAKAEIAQSAYADNLANYPLEIAYIQGNGDTGKLAMLLSSDLQAVGFTITLNEVPWVLFCNNEAEVATSPNITNAFAVTNYPEAGSILEFKYASWTVGNWNQNEWLQDEKFDNLLNAALETIDDQERLDKYAELQTYLVDEVVPSVYTFNSVIKPIYNSARFDWRLSDGNPHPSTQYNYYYADFRMK